MRVNLTTPQENASTAPAGPRFLSTVIEFVREAPPVRRAVLDQGSARQSRKSCERRRRPRLSVVDIQTKNFGSRAGFEPATQRLTARPHTVFLHNDQWHCASQRRQNL